jgi:hypothetical protein
VSEGFRLIHVDGTNKLYRYDYISEIRLHNDRVEVINWRLINGEKEDRILTMERIFGDGNIDIGQKIMEEISQYHSICSFIITNVNSSKKNIKNVLCLIKLDLIVYYLNSDGSIC